MIEYDTDFRAVGKVRVPYLYCDDLDAHKGCGTVDALYESEDALYGTDMRQVCSDCALKICEEIFRATPPGDIKKEFPAAPTDTMGGLLDWWENLSTAEVLKVCGFREVCP